MSIAIIGLGFGDEGKGSMVDWACRETNANLVVRHNGGPQALHHVVLPDGRAHGFAQFGSGTFQLIPTLMSRKTIVAPWAWLNEAVHLEELGVTEPLKLLKVSEDALLLTPTHKALCRWRETQRGSSRHGSTGIGIGEVMRFATELPDQALHVKDIFTDEFGPKVQRLNAWAIDQSRGQVAEFVRPYAQQMLQPMFRGGMMVSRAEEDDMLRDDRIVFEGAQGVLLDEDFGFHPYTTWSTTTFENVYELLLEAGNTHGVKRMGVLRSYLTRHGPGPFPTEMDEIEAKPYVEAEVHNQYGKWMGLWRVGAFDARLLDYALRVVGGVDSLAITHMDVTVPRAVVEYEPNHLLPLKTERESLSQQEELTNLLFAATPGKRTSLSEVLQHFDVVASYGPTYKNKIVGTLTTPPSPR
jgi:adenylosuccinate synthase